MGVLKPELIFKSIVPIIMAGILGIYGLIVAVILVGRSKYASLAPTNYLIRMPTLFCSQPHPVHLLIRIQALGRWTLLRTLFIGK